jgi:hypothetical protein
MFSGAQLWLYVGADVARIHGFLADGECAQLSLWYLDHGGVMLILRFERLFGHRSNRSNRSTSFSALRHNFLKGK